jgi:hypothetical protein
MRLMRLRTVFGAVLGALLPVPLLVLLLGVMHPIHGAQDPKGPRVSPVLDIEERTRRVTYRRDCARNEDCDPPLACLLDTFRGRRYCTDRQCTADTQCLDGEVCRAIPTMGRELLVRFCVPLGVRAEGEMCVDLPDDRGAACAPGLVCGSYEGWCGRPCRPGDAASCPDGFFCADTVPRPVCLPTCEARGCPEGQLCIRHDEGTSACATVLGPQCQQSPCPEGRECLVHAEPRRPGMAWMECVVECGEGHPACPDGLVCDRWHCLPPCDPEKSSTCGEGYRCEQKVTHGPWVCLPDR